MMNNLFFRKRTLRYEQLAQRQLLTAMSILPSPPTTAAAGEGETASVEQQGQRVTIIGSDNDDTIELILGETTHQLTVNGDSTTYAAAETSEFVVRGDAGNDSVSISGTARNESVQLADGRLELASDSYNVEVTLAEDITVNSGGGSDRAVLFDTEGDDVLNLLPDSANFQDASGNQVRVNGFARVLGFATAGGSDQANFEGTSGDDTFTGKADFSYLVGQDFWNYARGFERVEVDFATSGNDAAWLYGTAGDDQAAVSAEAVTLTLDGGSVIEARGFAAAHVLAAGGADSATLQGTDDASDRFEWNPESAEFTSSLPSGDVVTSIVDFENVVATGGESTDTAELFGSNAADALIALPEVAQLTTPDATVMAHEFAFVATHGGDGDDTAHLEDSRFNDNHYSQPGFSYLSGPGYFNLISGFDVIDIAATNGGYDISNSHFGATIYTVSGGFNSFPQATDGEGNQVRVGQFVNSTTGGQVFFFTHDDLVNNRITYVHNDDNDDPFDVNLTFRIENGLGLETTGAVSFPINKDGAGKTFELSVDDITGDITNVTQPLVTDFFVLDFDQYWLFGNSRNERVFGISRFRATGPGNLGRVEGAPYFSGSRVNQSALATFPTEWIADLEARDATPVPNYDLIDGAIVEVGDAFLNPPEVDF